MRKKADKINSKIAYMRCMGILFVEREREKDRKGENEKKKKRRRGRAQARSFIEL